MTDQQIVSAMVAFGGSFTHALAQAWRCADSSNQRKIKDAFPELWTEYEELAELHQQKQASR